VSRQHLTQRRAARTDQTLDFRQIESFSDVVKKQNAKPAAQEHHFFLPLMIAGSEPAPGARTDESEPARASA
jgi:hypothetical protein